MATMRSVDLNADLGEGFGPWRMGDDPALLAIVSSANIACGFHAGDPEAMHAACLEAKARGVALGAHPGFDDKVGFGRRRLPLTLGEVERMVSYQVGAAMGVAALAGTRIRYAKAHGALSNWASEDEAVARAFARGVRAVSRDLVCLVIAATASEAGARREGVPVACEVFADRTYQPDGQLTPRSVKGAVIADHETAITQILAMLEACALLPVGAAPIPTAIDSICVHGDTPGAVKLASVLRAALAAAGFAIRPFAP